MVGDIVISMGKCDGGAILIAMAGESLWRMIVMARFDCTTMGAALATQLFTSVTGLATDSRI